MTKFYDLNTYSQGKIGELREVSADRYAKPDVILYQSKWYVSYDVAMILTQDHIGLAMGGANIKFGRSRYYDVERFTERVTDHIQYPCRSEREYQARIRAMKIWHTLTGQYVEPHLGE